MIERFDNFCMKPIFIHKYTKEKEQIADDFAGVGSCRLGYRGVF